MRLAVYRLAFVRLIGHQQCQPIYGNEALLMSLVGLTHMLSTTGENSAKLAVTAIKDSCMKEAVRGGQG